MELYDTDKKRWIYVEPQIIKHLGISQFWHIVFDAELRVNKPANFLDFGYMGHVQYFDLGKKNFMTYQVLQ